GAPLGSFMEGWAGWLGEPTLGDDFLKMSGVYVGISRTRADELRAGSTLDTGWAGFYYDTGLPRDKLKEVLLHCAANDLRAGVKVGLATDNVPVSMFWPMWQVVARRNVNNAQVAPEQAISRAEALRCATVDCAYVTFDEGRKGSLEPGKLADLAVLTADPLTV